MLRTESQQTTETDKTVDSKKRKKETMIYIGEIARLPTTEGGKKKRTKSGDNLNTPDRHAKEFSSIPAFLLTHPARERGGGVGKAGGCSDSKRIHLHKSLSADSEMPPSKQRVVPTVHKQQRPYQSSQVYKIELPSSLGLSALISCGLDQRDPEGLCEAPPCCHPTGPDPSARAQTPPF